MGITTKYDQDGNLTITFSDEHSTVSEYVLARTTADVVNGALQDYELNSPMILNLTKKQVSVIAVALAAFVSELEEELEYIASDKETQK